jgi:hypothetical protein
MKIILTLISIIILSTSPFILSIKLKTDNKNSLTFSTSNFKQSDKPKLMENIIFNKSTKIRSQIVNKKINFILSYLILSYFILYYLFLFFI